MKSHCILCSQLSLHAGIENRESRPPMDCQLTFECNNEVKMFQTRVKPEAADKGWFSLAMESELES